MFAKWRIVYMPEYKPFPYILERRSGIFFWWPDDVFKTREDAEHALAERTARQKPTTYYTADGNPLK